MEFVRGSLSLTFLVLCAAVTFAHADEGMWVFNNLPLDRFKARHGFVPPPGWADHLRSSAVRFNNGGSGSFVSANGLIMTNHHVGADTLAKVSTSQKDFYKEGFYARNLDEEIKAPDLELNVLVGIEDVTDRVNSAVPPGSDDANAEKARRQVMAAIEKESTDRTGMRSDVVTLYQGGQYHLYTYKKYTDVRLVFAPEFDIAFFGGDPDNFEYPRYDLDVCFFRAYENGKPAEVRHHLKWSRDGTREGELIFVAGHPGRTDRLNTVASLTYLRDLGFPALVDYLKAKENFLLDFSSRGSEAARQAKEELFSIQNSRKARIGGLEGLRDPAFMARKTLDEKVFRKSIESDPKRRAAYASAWDRIARAQEAAKRLTTPFNMIERGRGFDTELFEIARKLVRLAAEKAKPNAERLKEYRESAIPSLELSLFSEAPIYPDLEEAKLAFSMAYLKKTIPDSPIVRDVLADRPVNELARDLVRKTSLADVEVRRKLAAGGIAAIESSNDPMIKLARDVDTEARSIRKSREDEVEGVEASNYALIARAIFELKGDSVYPDATFTLRLSYGVVKGIEVDGIPVPAYTTFAGAFEHAKKHGDKAPYALPNSWHEARSKDSFRPDTPFNFISTADIIGGNSGSPVVNRNNEVVGLIFDGNIQSLVLDFGYDDRIARAVSVDSRGILEALRSIYHADSLANELSPPSKP